MKISRKKNAVKGIFFGYLNKIITIIFPFIIRTIIINVLGVQYLGLNSLFSSILTILNLADLGFSTAIVYSMYKPIAEDNHEMVNALLNFYKKVYRIVGLIVLVFGLIAMPFLPYLINGTHPADINLYSLYSIFLLNSVIGYFFFAYKSSLFSAHQRNDILSKAGTIISLCLYAFQITVLLLFKNYYTYIIFLPLSSIASNLLINYLSKKMFPQYFCKGSIDKETKNNIKKQIIALFTHRIGYVIQSSIDNISISAFLGLTLLGKYNNYYYLITAVQAFITIIKQSMVAGIGNSLIVETKEENKKSFYTTFFWLSWIVGWCTACFVSLYQPFMQVWVGTENMFGMSIVLCLSSLFYVSEIRGTVGTYKDGLGMWWEDRFKPIVISIVNLIGTVISAYFGFFEGIILSTIAAYLFVGIPWETHVFFKHYMQESKKKYYFKLLYNIFVTTIAATSTYLLCSLIPLTGILKFVINLIICAVIPNLIFILCYFKTYEFKQLFSKEKLKYFKEKTVGLVKKALVKIYKKLPKKIKDEELYQNNKHFNLMLKLNKKYGKYIDTSIKCSKETSNYVFTCWLQGEDNAPPLVKSCIKSMKKHFKDKKFVIITNENFKEYTNIPEFILEKWQKGIISNTHFSDILRTNLLINNGGLWLDATVLCTGNIDRYIDEKTELFVFKNEHRSCNSMALSSWLIYAKKNNPILVNTQNLLFEYWKKNNKLKDYFLFHILFTICTKYFENEWGGCLFTQTLTHILFGFTNFLSLITKKDSTKLKLLQTFINFLINLTKKKWKRIVFTMN